MYSVIYCLSSTSC